MRLTAPHQPVVRQVRIPMDIVMTKNEMRISHRKELESVIIQHNDETGSSCCLVTKSMSM